MATPAAWDNAKKIVEVELNDKGSDLHAATVVGDTVGDPYKDTSSVALNPIIKFTTLFGLLAVEIGVSNPAITHWVGVGPVPGGAVLRLPLVLRNEDHGTEGGAGVTAQGAFAALRLRGAHIRRREPATQQKKPVGRKTAGFFEFSCLLSYALFAPPPLAERAPLRRQFRTCRR
jgi:hypothetical protein